MSHPILGHDYAEKTSDESKKEHQERRRKAIRKVAKKMSGPKNLAKAGVSSILRKRDEYSPSAKEQKKIFNKVWKK
jgi:ribosomal protein S21